MQVFDLTGKFRRMFNTKGIVRSLAVDRGCIYADDGLGVHVYRVDGVFITDICDFAIESPEQLQATQAAAADIRTKASGLFGRLDSRLLAARVRGVTVSPIGEICVSMPNCVKVFTFATE